MANKTVERYFLCGKTVDEVNQLIKGKFGCVCDECISIAHGIITEKEDEEIYNNMYIRHHSTAKQFGKKAENYLIIFYIMSNHSALQCVCFTPFC